MTFEEIIEKAAANYKHGDNVRVISIESVNGARETTIDHYKGNERDVTFGIRKCGDGVWGVYNIDWVNRYGEKWWYSYECHSEVDALEVVMKMSDAFLMR